MTMCGAGVGAPPPDALDAAPGADLPQRLHLVHGDRHPRAIPHHRPSQVVGRLFPIGHFFKPNHNIFLVMVLLNFFIESKI